MRLPANYESLDVRAIAEFDAHLASHSGAGARQTIRPLIEKIVVQPGSARGGKRHPIQLHRALHLVLRLRRDCVCRTHKRPVSYETGLL